MTAAHNILIVGDVHGHLQLVLSAAVLWQRNTGQRLDAIYLCGDVGTFTSLDELDSATRAHAKRDRSELEFLEQWIPNPPAPWLAQFFTAVAQGGLGLSCPVIMIHGNHEGFAHLGSIATNSIPASPVRVEQLPPVDTAGYLRWLQPGWVVECPSGLRVGGIGGIEQGSRESDYPPMAYLDDAAVLALASQGQGAVDILLSHQGPAAVQRDQGAPTLDLLLELGSARYWFHGHSVRNAGPMEVHGTTVFPLYDAHRWSRGDCGWAWCSVNEKKGLHVRVELFAFLRELSGSRWQQTESGLLVSPLVDLWADRHWPGGD